MHGPRFIVGILVACCRVSASSDRRMRHYLPLHHVPLTVLHQVARFEPRRCMDHILRPFLPAAIVGTKGLEFEQTILKKCPSLKASAAQFTCSDQRRLDRHMGRLRSLTRHLHVPDPDRNGIYDLPASLRMAMEVAALAHHGQLRSSGDPFIDHVMHLSYIIALRRLDLVAVTAALCHDFDERSTLTSERHVKALFGSQVAWAVQHFKGATRVCIIELHGIVAH